MFAWKGRSFPGKTPAGVSGGGDCGIPTPQKGAPSPAVTNPPDRPHPPSTERPSPSDEGQPNSPERLSTTVLPRNPFESAPTARFNNPKALPLLQTVSSSVQPCRRGCPVGTRRHKYRCRQRTTAPALRTIRTTARHKTQQQFWWWGGKPPPLLPNNPPPSRAQDSQIIKPPRPVRQN